jgi:murein DD-endopeptidase MepM/ murein hydrolase activator NlpD
MASSRPRRGLAVLAFTSACAATALAQDLKSTAASDRFRWPLRGNIVEPFKPDVNDGIDIAARPGEAVLAAADGVCIAANEDMKTYGKLVVLRHANGFVTVYADLSEIGVKEGDKVRRGQIIAKSGQSGGAASPRLHFELRHDGKAVDPVPAMVPN